MGVVVDFPRAWKFAFLSVFLLSFCLLQWDYGIVSDFCFALF